MARFLGLFLLLFSTLVSAKFLEVEEAFKASAHLSADGEFVNVRIKVGEDIYLYKDKVSITTAKTSEITLDLFSLPKGELHHDDMVYFDALALKIPLVKMREDAKRLDLIVNFQGCSEAGLCYQPITKNFSLTTNGAVEKSAQTAPTTSTTKVSETDEIASILKDASFWYIIISFFGFGLLLSLTPCVFPMIPILSGIIVAQGNNMNVKKAFVLSLVYVLAMALTYTVVGVLAGLFGSNLQAAFQTPWILFSFAFIFVLLSLSMFGFYELQLPSSWQTKLTKTSEGQTGLVGVAVMGLLSALIVGPCVAAPLAGALIYIGQTGDALLGGVALFSLSIGMGVPLLIIGTSAGKFMPKPGAWMEAIKYIFGVMLLGVAIWMLSRVVPAQVTMILWSLLLIVSAIYMGALEPMQQGIANVKKMIKAIGFVMLVYGLFLLVGAFTGAKHPFDPLEKLGSSTITVTGGDTTEMSEEVVFTRVGSLDELHKMIKQSDQKVMLDFYADWCVSCKEMEEYVFNDPRVREKLSEYTLLQVDVTRNNAADKEILKYFGLYGPPTVLFFGTDNEEIKSMRIVGEVSTSEFISYLDELEEF